VRGERWKGKVEGRMEMLCLPIVRRVLKKDILNGEWFKRMY